ncbi:hypothetical protein GBD14_11975, partial [Bifidobacterium longum]
RRPHTIRPAGASPGSLARASHQRAVNSRRARCRILPRHGWRTLASRCLRTPHRISACIHTYDARLFRASSSKSLRTVRIAAS